MSAKVLPLKGLKSVWALNAFNSLLLGLAIENAMTGQDIEQTYAAFEKLDEKAKEKSIKDALQRINLQEDDMKNLLAFATDNNGIPYTEENIKSLAPEKIIDALSRVCLEISKIKVHSIDADVKKNSPSEA
jgi:F0F1-type ATP synthase delta subunit